MRIKLEELPPEYQAQVRDTLARADANNKSGVGNALETEKEVKGFDGPVNIYYRETRRRLVDSDNQFSKYFTDALVSAGILRGDSPKFIPQAPKKTQIKGEEAKTIIIIEEV